MDGGDEDATTSNAASNAATNNASSNTTTRDSMSSTAASVTSQSTNPRGTMYVADASGTAKGGHIEYLIDISHAGDNWFTWKRFREFEQLQRMLAKEGIRADIPVSSSWPMRCDAYFMSTLRL